MPDDDPSTGEFPRLCRLFPLPRVVLFPHAVLPLHIFEPRYRQMTEDALADGDGLIALVQLSDGPPEAHGVDPPIEQVACLGRILEHQRLPDGRFDFLLLGLKRVRLIREVPSDRLYRQAEFEVLEDEDAGQPDEGRRAEPVALFREVASGGRRLEPELEDLLSSSLPLGRLTDLLAHALGIPAATKQSLLTETLVSQRVETLVEILGRIVRQGPAPGPGAGRFPPPFSTN